MKNQNKDLLLTTAELLASSDSFNSKIPYQYKQEHFSPPRQPLYTFTNEDKAIPQKISNTMPSQRNSQDEIAYYKNMLSEMNNEIGNINSKLSQIDNTMTVSRMSSIDIDNCLSNRSNKSNKQIEHEMKENIRNNYTISMIEKDKKLIELEENRKKLMEKNKELERQLSQLEQYANTTNISNITIDKSETPTIDINNTVPIRKQSKPRSPSFKAKSAKRSNSTRMNSNNKTKNMFNRQYSNISNLKRIPSGDSKDGIHSQIDSIKKLVLNNAVPSTIILQLNNLENYLVSYMKSNDKGNKNLIDKQAKQIEKLTKENNEFKQKMTKVKEIMK